MGMAGLKGSNLEGGIRVPLAFYWPERLAGGRTCDPVVASYDFLTTMADLLGVKLQKEKDGQSFLPSLLKGRNLPKDRYVTIGSYNGPTLINNEGWKLRYDNNNHKFELFRLRTDPNEKYDVILRFPKEAEALKKTLTEACGGNINRGVY
jgi:arylsulfatase A-like enzyme